MKYLEKKHLFLFDTANEFYISLNSLEEENYPLEVLARIDTFFEMIAKNFEETIINLVYKHLNSLDLNIHNNSHNIDMVYIKTVCNTIINNPRVNDILFRIKGNVTLKKIGGSSFEFDLESYRDLLDLLEELDFMCVLILYSFVLNENIESVLSFILHKIIDSVTFSNYESLDKVNDNFLKNVEHKLRLFNKISGETRVSMILKNNDHILYKINNVLKIVQLVK